MTALLRPCGLNVAIALSADQLVASWRDRGRRSFRPRSRGSRVTRRHVASIDSSSADPECSLGKAFDDLATAIGGARNVNVRIAVLPPLTKLRRLELPRMRGSELRQVVARNANRYFLDSREPVIASAEWLESRRRSPAPLITAVVPSSLLDALGAAAASQGWSIEKVVPAHVAWRDLTCSTYPALRSGRVKLVVCSAAETQILDLSDGVIIGVRRAWCGDIQEILELLSASDNDVSSNRLAIIGTPDQSSAITRACTTPMIVGVNETPGQPAMVDEVAQAAPDAAVAGLEIAPCAAQDLELVPAAVRRVREKRVRRAAMACMTISASLLVASAGLHLLSVHRQIATIRERRQALRVRVDRAVALRDTIDVYRARLTDLATLEEKAPRWSAVISHIAEGLSISAHLTALRAQGDSLLLEGESTDAAQVFADMRDTPGISSVRANSPIRQEIVPGHDPIERWTLAAHAVAALDTAAAPERVARAKDSRMAEDK